MHDIHDVNFGCSKRTPRTWQDSKFEYNHMLYTLVNTNVCINNQLSSIHIKNNVKNGINVPVFSRRLHICVRHLHFFIGGMNRVFTRLEVN